MIRKRTTKCISKKLSPRRQMRVAYVMQVVAPPQREARRVFWRNGTHVVAQNRSAVNNK